MGVKARGRLGRIVLVGLALAFLGTIVPSGEPVGFGQGQSGDQGEEGIPNLMVKDVELLVSNRPTFYLESAGPNVTINAAIVNDGTAPAQGFDVSIQYRREDEQGFRDEELCILVGTAGRCSDLSLEAGAETTAVGVLPTNTLSPGRYIIRVGIDPQGVSQTTRGDDSRERLLLIGIGAPEYHPTSLTFTPPSPISQGTQVTVRVEIENTGKPENPEIEVTFEYCLEGPVCLGYTSKGFREGVNGVTRLAPDQTRPLSQGRPLVVTNVLDTTDLQTGRYLFRVRIESSDGRELDEANNEMTTRLTITTPGGFGGPNPPRCRLSGDVITLGKGVGTLQVEGRRRSTEVIYMGVKSESGQVSLHAVTKESFETPSPDGTCQELEGSPLPLQAEITSFVLDQKVKLLYVGLANGQLVVVDVDRADALVTVTRVVSSANLWSLDTRLAGAGTGQVFVGAQDRRLYRLTVNKDGQGNIVVSRQETCVSVSQPIKTVRIFQGKIYFTSDDGLMRMDETRCDGRFTTLFTAGDEIRSLAIGQLAFGITLSPRILVGAADGNLHVLNIFGQELADSPLDLGTAVTALDVNDGKSATSAGQETAHAGTVTGTMHAVDLRRMFVQCSFATPTQQQINVVAVDDGRGGLPDTGYVFIGSEDTNLYVMDGSCRQVETPRPTLGPIRANLLLDAEQGIFGPSSVKVLYGGGDGLYELNIPL